MKEACPYCGEDVSVDADRCEHCGESLVEGVVQHEGGSKKVVWIIVAVICVGLFCMCIPIIAAIAIPNLIEARKNGNETAAIGALKTISSAQMLFREADKEGDGVLDYATLNELGTAGTTGLVDMVLASGTKNGYFFEASPSPDDPEFKWMAVANPALPGTTGDRYFAINHEGVTYYSTMAPIPLTPECEIPEDRGDIMRVGW